VEHPRSGLTAARGSGMPTLRLRPPVDYERYGCRARPDRCPLRRLLDSSAVVDRWRAQL
jgi:hypothetical protein